MKSLTKREPTLTGIAIDNAIAVYVAFLAIYLTMTTGLVPILLLLVAVSAIFFASAWQQAFN